MSDINPPQLPTQDLITAPAGSFSYQPRTQTELRSLLELCDVYRRFIPNLSGLTTPLLILLEEGQPFKLEPLDRLQREAIATLVGEVINPPVLAPPQANLPYAVDAEGSRDQANVALFQVAGQERLPVGFWSRPLSVSERSYSAVEKEGLPIFWALEVLRPYLQGSHFTVYTDSRMVPWLMTDPNPRGPLRRWRHLLAELEFTIVCEGTETVYSTEVSTDTQPGVNRRKRRKTITE